MPRSSTSLVIMESTRCSTLRTWFFTTLQLPIQWSYHMSQHQLSGVPSRSWSTTTTTTIEEAPTEEIEGIMTDETVSTIAGTYHHYLVRWRGWPASDCTWLRAEDIMQLNPELLHDFQHHYSLEANFSKPGRLDENPFSSRTWRTYVRRRRNSIIRLFSSLLCYFVYLVVAFSPTSVKTREFFLNGAYRKPTRLTG